MNRSGLLLALGLMAWANTGQSSELLPNADAEAGEQKAAVCAACHGQDGNSSNGEWPKLAGQHASYLYDQLKAYKSGERNNAIMMGQSAGLSDQDMKDLSAYYASQAIEPGVADEAFVELGQQIYLAGNTTNGVPACAACHGPSGKGIPATGYPRVSAQHAQYTATQLRMYASGERMGQGGMMHDIASRLSEEEIEAVASYIEGLN
jgi:cytochrome c553